MVSIPPKRTRARVDRGSPGGCGERMLGWSGPCSALMREFVSIRGREVMGFRGDVHRTNPQKAAGFRG